LFVVIISLLRFHFDPVYLISWDVFGYYLYLPGTFIYHDPFFTNPAWIQDLMVQYHASPTLYQLKPGPDGALVNVYSMGMAMAYLPAFLSGHAIAYIFNYPADGFSLPYQYALALEGLLALGFGLFMLRKLLLIWFSEWITLFVLVVISLGTNFFEMAFGYFHSPHGFIFLAYTLILWYTYLWHERPRNAYAVLLGLLVGWVTLTRPVDIVVLAILFFWQMGGRFSLAGKLMFFLRNKTGIFLFGCFAILPVLPQLFFWKAVTGQYYYNAYFSGSEGMDLLSPHTWNFLFSYRKGWLLYTPVMLFALAGLVVLYRRARGLFWPFFIFLFFFIYLYSSWSIWWYAHCFSQRVMVQAYPVLALMLGFSLVEMTRMNKPVRTGLYSLLVFLVCLNLFQTWQYVGLKILDGSRMTREYYWHVFGRTSVRDEDRKLLLIDRSTGDTDILADTSGYSRKVLLACDFEKQEAWFSQRSDSLSHSGSFALKMDSSSVFTAPFRYCYSDLSSSDHAWVRVSFYVFTVEKDRITPFSLVMLTEHKKDLPPYKYRTANIENPGYGLKQGQWNEVVFDYLTPEVRSVKDTIAIYFWHRGKLPVYIDDLRIVAFSPIP
jgi:hypothetical protein